MKLTISTRRALYRECKKIIGAERITLLQQQAYRLKSKVRHLRSSYTKLLLGLKTDPWITLDAVHRVDNQTHFISGHIKSDGDPTSFIIDYESGLSLDASDLVYLYESRKTHQSSGQLKAFAVLCTGEAGDRPSLISIQNQQEKDSRVTCKQISSSDNALQDVINLLGTLAQCTSSKRELLSSCLGEAIYQRWAERQADKTTEHISALKQHELIRYNQQYEAEKPLTSLIIPIYGRYDFIEYQLAHFVQDEHIKDCEILYVIDDPRLTKAVKASLSTLTKLYPIAFSVLYLENNLGYAGANNAGAAIASAKNLLLLNSDIVPEKPGWLDTMYRAINNNTDNYVLGARLLYNDNTIQHDGMRFEKAENFDGLWLNRHPGKGLPREVFPDSPTAQPRAAITGACMLVSAKNFKRLEGFEEAYILGDFEDSDFCMKAQRAGIQIAIATQAQLYHLERQSQSLVTQARWKQDLTHYNCWVHSVRWEEELQQRQSARAA